MASKDYILKDNIHNSQKDNLNPDGSSNMTWSKKYKRFNQCFISSATSAYNQTMTRILTKNPKIKRKFSGNGFINEFTYLQVLLSNLNKNGSALEDNDARYNWAEHEKFLNRLFGNGNFEKPPGIWIHEPWNLNKCIQVIKDGYQPIASIYIKKFYSNGAGHVITVVGWRENEKGVIEGLFINDPAGNLLSGKSYYDPAPGKEVFYPASIFKDIFSKNNQLLYFKENAV